MRATGKARFQGYLRRFDWRSLEIDALIGLGRLGEAETALVELEAALAPAGPPSALVAVARLRGDLAIAAGHQAAAAAAFETAWHRAEGLRVPLELAQLEISDARRLRAAGQPREAVTRLRSARQRLYVSVKTVEFHLGHIFGKLGIRSRKDLIARISAPHPCWASLKMSMAASLGLSLCSC